MSKKPRHSPRAVLSRPARGPAMPLHRRKGLNSRGETLVETLAAILIAVLSVTLLVGSVTASSNLARQADQSDTSFFDLLTKAEARGEALSGIGVEPKVEITESGTTVTIPVQVYGGEDLYSYARQAATPEGGDGP